MNDTRTDGILPCQSIEALIESGAVEADSPFLSDQVQPASLDLRLGQYAWRVRASFLPGARKVSERLVDVSMHRLDLSKGAARAIGLTGVGVGRVVAEIL